MVTRSRPEAAAVDIEIGDADSRTFKVYLLDQKFNLQEATVSVGRTTSAGELARLLLAFARTADRSIQRGSAEGVLLARVNPETRVDNLPSNENEILVVAAENLSKLMKRGFFG